jgi:hypothetical protein
MKILRRVFILLFVAADIALAIYAKNGIKEPPQEIEAANVSIVEAREQTAAEEHPSFIKKDYVLVLPEGTNVALKKKVEDNGFTDVYRGERAVDGFSDGSSYWEGTKDYPNTLTVDLEAPTKIHTVRIALNPMPIWGKRNQKITVKISDDGTNFTELVRLKEYTFDPDYGNEVQIPFDEVESRFVQLEFTGNTGAGGGQVAEFEVYSK